MRNPSHIIMTKISAHALLAGIGMIGLGTLTNTAYASTETQINHVNAISQVSNSKISLITIPSAASQTTSTPVHHSFFGSIISGIGHAIKSVVHTAGPIVSAIGNTIKGVTHTIGSVIKTIPKVIVSGIFTVAHALAFPLNIAVALGKTGLGILSTGANIFGNLATLGLNLANSILSIVGSALSLVDPTGISGTVVDGVGSILSTVSSGISIGTTIISNVAQLISQIPPVIYGAENLFFGIGHTIASAIGNTLGGVIGGTISGVGSLIGGTLSGIGHALTSISATASPRLAITSTRNNVTNPIISHTVSVAVMPPHVSLLG